MSTASELEKPSVILRREAEKPVPNWTRKELYQGLPVNGHLEICRCQLAVIQDHLVETGALDSADIHSDAVVWRVASIYERDPEIFFGAMVLNDRLVYGEHSLVRAAFDASRSYFSPEMYRAYQVLAPKKLREVADHYARHGL